MTRLNHVLAEKTDAQKHTQELVGNLTRILERPQLLHGLSRTYQSKDDSDEPLPPETSRVQYTVTDILDGLSKGLTLLFDLSATIEWGNTIARADVVVAGKVILKEVPATYLLFLEKQLSELESFLRRIPPLDLSEEWHLDHNNGVWATEKTWTTRTRKVMKNHELFKGDNHHPPQVQVYTEDVPMGKWETVKYSGALPFTRLNELIVRVRRLQAAVKTAREEANTTVVERQSVGESIFDYLFAGE